MMEYDLNPEEATQCTMLLCAAFQHQTKHGKADIRGRLNSYCVSSIQRKTKGERAEQKRLEKR